MSIVIAAWPEYAEDNILTVPCLPADSHLLVLSVGASRIQYGVSLTFFTVYPTDMKTVLPKNISTDPLSSNGQIQWIEFHRLVGFSKFVIYNTTDANNHLSTIINIYTQKYPGFVDVLPTRYFQVEALHDCLIRYGDQSDWLGMLDLDEHIVPLHPYKTIVDYVHENRKKMIQIV
ncbi:unnamed protein product [Adineta steineri]|uniref:Glycosyltransferase family 92 protein n=1 Tax=Adineta steineri TaxID=433720 RepID=A0A814KF14_9BILA|nr:unnamed protein product [Adineta steineri]